MLIINSVLGDATGGRWQVVCDYRRILEQQGHDVLLLLDEAQPATLPGRSPGIEVMRIRNHGHYDWLAARRLARRLRDTRPAIAVAHCSRSVALLKRALGDSTPVIAVTHSTKVRRLLRADAVIALTDTLREKIRTASPGGTPPVYVVPNRINIPHTACPSPRPLHQPPVIGALGRFDRVKGFDLFVDALAWLAGQGLDFVARLAGAGEEEARLREQIRRRGLTGRIELAGWVAPGAVDSFLSELDLLCVPARSDAFGLTPLQGAVQGVPMVLSTASGHCAMFAENTEALFFERGNAEALGRRIQQFLDDHDLREQLPPAAFDRVVTCYSEEAVTRGIMDAVHNTLILHKKQ